MYPHLSTTLFISTMPLTSFAIIVCISVYYCMRKLAFDSKMCSKFAAKAKNNQLMFNIVHAIQTFPSFTRRPTNRMCVCGLQSELSSRNSIRQSLGFHIFAFNQTQHLQGNSINALRSVYNVNRSNISTCVCVCLQFLASELIHLKNQFRI